MFDLQLKKLTKHLDDNRVDLRKQRPMIQEDLWNFIEATDFSFNILTGQGTGIDNKRLSPASRVILAPQT